jgi:hypothetical protein
MLLLLLLLLCCLCWQVVREASKRVLGLRPFDVQLIGGMILHEGQIAEMRTGARRSRVLGSSCWQQQQQLQHRMLPAAAEAPAAAEGRVRVVSRCLAAQRTQQ